MRSQKGKILSWVIFTVLIVAGFALLLFLQKNKAPAPEGEKPSEVSAPQETKTEKPRKTFATEEAGEMEKAEKDMEAVNKALQSGEGCDAIEFDEALRQLCEDTLLYNSALQRNDEKLCEQIADKDLKTKCLDHVYLNLAVNNSDAELCKKIENKETKQNCLDQIQASSGRTAESAKDCEVIQDPLLKQNCLDNFYFSSGIKNLTAASCEQIKSAELKDRCEQTIEKNLEVIEASKTTERTFKSTEEQMGDCDSLTGDKINACKDEANYKLALEKKDLSYCNAITDSVKQSQCISVQSANINNYYLRQAISKKDPSLCSKLLDAGLKATCLENAK